MDPVGIMPDALLTCALALLSIGMLNAAEAIVSKNVRFEGSGNSEPSIPLSADTLIRLFL